jgi:uncharacterized membrane protein
VIPGDQPISTLEGEAVLKLLGNANVELPIKPEDFIFAMLGGMWQGLMMFLSAVPWWLWVFFVIVVIYRLYKWVDRKMTPAEFRRPRRRRRQHDW